LKIFELIYETSIMPPRDFPQQDEDDYKYESSSRRSESRPPKQKHLSVRQIESFIESKINSRLDNIKRDMRVEISTLEDKLAVAVGKMTSMKSRYDRQIQSLHEHIEELKKNQNVYDATPSHGKSKSYEKQFSFYSSSDDGMESGIEISLGGISKQSENKLKNRKKWKFKKEHHNPERKSLNESHDELKSDWVNSELQSGNQSLLVNRVTVPEISIRILESERQDANCIATPAEEPETPNPDNSSLTVASKNLANNPTFKKSANSKQRRISNLPNNVQSLTFEESHSKKTVISKDGSYSQTTCSKKQVTPSYTASIIHKTSQIALYATRSLVPTRIQNAVGHVSDMVSSTTDIIIGRGDQNGSSSNPDASHRTFSVPFVKPFIDWAINSPGPNLNNQKSIISQGFYFEKLPTAIQIRILTYLSEDRAFYALRVLSRTFSIQVARILTTIDSDPNNLPQKLTLIFKSSSSLLNVRGGSLNLELKPQETQYGLPIQILR
jgi:hypothetical protein